MFMIGEDADHGLLLMLSCQSRKLNLYINWYLVLGWRPRQPNMDLN